MDKNNQNITVSTEKEVELVSVSGIATKDQWERLIEEIKKFCKQNKINFDPQKIRRDDKGDDRYIDFIFLKDDAKKVKKFLDNYTKRRKK